MDKETYQLIVASLERIERKTDAVGELLALSNAEGLKEHAAISERIVKVEADMRWYSKISGTIGVVAASVISYLIEHFRRST